MKQHERLERILNGLGGLEQFSIVNIILRG
jgi:hypothetical protein